MKHYRALLEQILSTNMDKTGPNALQDFISILHTCLQKTKILQKLQQVQMLDHLDVEVVVEIYNMLCKKV